jgi:four helix bundle protein
LTNAQCIRLNLRFERASISVSANISEGFELGTKKQFIKHLYIAKGSCGEVRSLLYFTLEVDLLPIEDLKILIERAKRLSIMIYNLIKSQGINQT